MKLMVTDKVDFDRTTKEFCISEEYKEYKDDKPLKLITDILMIPGELSALLFIIMVPVVILFYLIKSIIKGIKIILK